MLKQRALLKSIMSYSKDATEAGFLTENFNKLFSSKIVFALDQHAKIYAYIRDHTNKFVQVPSAERVLKYFEEDPEVTDELVHISKEPTLLSANFLSLLEEVYEEQQKKELVDLLKDTSQISVSGKKVGSDFIAGPKKAVEHFLHNSMDFLRAANDIKSSGSLKGESRDSVEEYYDRKRNKKFDGLLTGLPSIDRICRGIRPGELWLVVAFVSELKSTMTMNFAYTQAVEQGVNVKFVSLEMQYDVVRDIFICIHSANLNLWPGTKWDKVFPLNFDDIRDGTLSDEEEEFFEFLCDDFDNNPEYGSIDIYQPEDGLTFSHLKVWAETENKKKPFQALYLDYIELMKSEGSVRDYTLELNQRIKDLKQFALNFDGKKGLRVISAYQANRKGKEHADKHDGEYRLDALSYANEAERSADVIISSYLNEELRANKQNRVCCLKNRSRPKFRPFNGKTYLPSRKIFEDPFHSGDGPVDEPFKRNQTHKMECDDLINEVLS